MKINGATELARMQSFQRRAASIENALDTTSKELSSGIKSDLHKATGGNLGKLHAIERTLAKNIAYDRNINFLELRVDGAQNALGLIQEPLDALSVDLVSAAGVGDYVSSTTLAATARLDFKSAVSALNTEVNGQTIFGGAAVDRQALAGGEAILAKLDAAVSGAASAADVITAIDAYFAPGGEFMTNDFLGSATDIGAADVGAGVRISYNARADDAEIVSVLKALALASVVAGGTLAGNQNEQMAVLSEAGAQLLEAKEGLLDYRGNLGVTQQNIESSKARNVAETGTLELARAKLIEADPAETATFFEALEAQLKTVYTVTTRLSDLSFINFMR